MLVVRIGLFGWIFELDFGRPPKQHDEDGDEIPVRGPMGFTTDLDES